MSRDPRPDTPESDMSTVEHVDGVWDRTWVGTTTGLGVRRRLSRPGDGWGPRPERPVGSDPGAEGSCLYQPWWSYSLHREPKSRGVGVSETTTTWTPSYMSQE